MPLSTPVCVCFKAISVNEKERPCLILCFFLVQSLNRSTFSIVLLVKTHRTLRFDTKSADFFFTFLTGCLFVLKFIERKPGGCAYSLFYREIEFITQINNFTYICIFLSDSIKHLTALWVVLTPKLRTAASNFSAV